MKLRSVNMEGTPTVNAANRARKYYILINEVKKY